ncbi:Sensor histidine kinase LiaS [Arthrobacter ulcerisalmonis]|uniref:Sensor histidine kinase LiaS n=1 Tax=Arthrobacter ulcerisalmonis TaxID=2483813 RepID=A0A3P5WUW6_9MICC|nr:Sensor histidine kinase LiaS [Arthrobacter ulcerisalmonis]
MTVANDGGRSARLLPARSVWTTSMVWWHLGFYAALVSVAYLTLFGQPVTAETAIVLVSMGVLAAVYPFLTRVSDLRTGRSSLYVVVLVLVVVFLAFVNNSSGALLFIAFPQVWMFTASQKQGIVATAVLCAGVAAGQVSRWGFATPDVYGITAQLVTSFVASCMIGLWISRVIEQSEQRAQLLAELEATRADLNAAEQARGALAERERMAREIHDTLAQGFTSIAMLSEAGQAQLRRDGPPELRRTLETISSTARESLAEARSLVASGVPTDVRGGDLLAALQRLPTSMHLAGIRVAVQIPETLPQLSSIHQVALLRTAQEALNNVRRHASATSATVKLRLAASGELRLSIEDNGTGFDPAAASPGFGLRSMAARLAEIGGWLDVASTGAGTRLTAVVPVPAGDAPGAPGTPKPATKEHPA